MFTPLASPEDFLPALERWEESRKAGREGLVLFKGSRGNRLERFVKLFMERKDHAV